MLAASLPEPPPAPVVPAAPSEVDDEGLLQPTAIIALQSPLALAER